MGLPLTVPGPVAASTPDTTPILTAKPLVRFTTLNVQPPTGVYVTVDDVVHVAIWNAVPGIVVNITYRILLADGTIQLGVQTYTPTSNRARNDFFAPLAEGFLLSVVVATSTPTILRGQCFVELDVARVTGSVPQDRQPLLSDYVTSANSFGWPGGQQRTSVEGPGYLSDNLLNNFSGNGNTQFIVPTGARWRIRGAGIQCTTDGVASSRQISVTVTAQGNTMYAIPAPVTQPASTVYKYSCAPSPYVPAAASTLQVIPIPPDMLLEASGVFEVDLSGGDAGDLTVVRLYVESWIEANS